MGPDQQPPWVGQAARLGGSSQDPAKLGSHLQVSYFNFQVRALRSPVWQRSDEQVTSNGPWHLKVEICRVGDSPSQNKAANPGLHLLQTQGRKGLPGSSHPTLCSCRKSWQIIFFIHWSSSTLKAVSFFSPWGRAHGDVKIATNNWHHSNWCCPRRCVAVSGIHLWSLFPILPLKPALRAPKYSSFFS